MEEIFPEFYTLADEIGRGDFYVTKRCIDLRDTVEYAAKIYNLNQVAVKSGELPEEEIVHEIEICRKLKHPHIVQLFNTIKQQETIYVISELLTGVDVCFEIINKVDEGFVYSELVASHYMQQLLQGIEYIHENNIVHRGVKPQSVVIASTHENAPVKIIDFGMAVEVPEYGYIQSERIGASYYMAPEIVKTEKYGYGVDIWSCGVIMYILLGGSLPFYGTSQKTYAAITEGEYDMSSHPWEFISDTAEEFIESMLTVDPTQRFSAEQALKHPWISGRDQFAERAHLEESVGELRKFNSKRKLKDAVLESMARRNLTNGRFSSLKNSRTSGQMQNSFDAPDKMDIVDNDRSLLDCMKTVQAVLMDIQTTTGGEEDENISFLSCMLENTKLQTMMEIYTSARAATKHLDVHADHKNAEEALYEVSVLLNSLNDMDPKCQRLKGILDKPHVKSLVKTHDDVIKELQGKNDIFNNNDGVTTTPTNPAGENLTRVRLVQFPKNPNEPMGITLKKTEKKQCLVARIIHGGMVHRQGTLHVGDEIKEINGINVATCSVERLQQLLRDAAGDVTFKIVPGLQSEERENKKLFMKCLFDYDPRGDDLIPCQQAGLPFDCGEIVEIVSKSDIHWWQARKGEDKQTVGLIPSPELQEKRIRNMALERDKKGGTVTCIWPKKQKKKSITRRYSARLNTAFDRLDLVTYEEVAYQKKSSRKSIILIGAHGVGRRHIKNQLVTRFPEKYSYPIPYTSRPPGANEKEGELWHFEKEAEMLRDIATHEYLEYGKHEGYLYGTKLSTVRDILEQKKIPILDIETPALKLIRCKEFYPYIIFISSPASYPESGDPKMDASLQRLIKDSVDLRNRYRHFFDYTIINTTIEETVEHIIEHLQQLEQSSEWVPAVWYY